MAKTDFTRDQTINIAVKAARKPTVWKIPFRAAAWRTAMRLTLL